MTVLCLCGEDHHRKLIPAYASAFRARGVRFLCVDWSPPFDSSLNAIFRRCPEKPSCIFHFESVFPLLPGGIEHSEIPTVSFQVDTHLFTERRIKWASLFDHAAIPHPEAEKRFQRDGHPGAFLVPHAVHRLWFDQPEVLREFEVGWVGATQGPIYRRRQEWLPRLAKSFRMNDWKRSYSLREVAEVYRRSRVVVNISRDDFPQDANQRVFEVLASGALLVTSLPTELTALGFEEGVHFAGFRHQTEILGIVHRFLRDDATRRRVAHAGREKVLREHTYDNRAAQVLQRLEQFGREKLAPARHWDDSRVQLTYLDYFAAHGVLDCAAKRLRRIAAGGLRGTLQGAALLGGAWARGRRYDHGTGWGGPAC